jgi:hypothetical protein
MNSERFYNSNPNHVVKNNTIYGPKTAVGVHTGATLFNNVVFGQTGSYRGISIDNPDADGYTRYVYHNTIDLPSSRAIVITGGTIDMRNNIGPTTSNNLATSSEYFVDQNSRNYQLVAGAAPFNRGVDLRSVVLSDHDGVLRDANPDIGAFELTGATTPPQPPQNLLVFP